MTKHDEKAVATAPTGNALVAADFGDDAGKGMENIDRSEYKIPLLRILDPKSPQVKPPERGGIAGAAPGKIFNPATGELYDELIFVPAVRDRNYVEYIKRDPDGSGGGFVTIRALNDDLVLELLATQGKFKKLQVDCEPPHEIAETFYLTGVAIPAKTEKFVTSPIGEPFSAMIPFASMQIKKYNGWMNLAMNFRYAGPKGADGKDTVIKPPIWAHQWHFKTQFEERGSQSWYGWVISLLAKKADGTPEHYARSLLAKTSPLYVAARDLAKAYEEGKAKGDFSKTTSGDVPESEIPM